MAFDFYEAAEDMAPAQAELGATATAAGVCNAVAFWFDLQLDETTTLSTSPYAAKARTSMRAAAVVLGRQAPAAPPWPAQGSWW